MATQNTQKLELEFPSLANALNILDLTVLSDLAGEKEDNSDLHPVFAIGAKQELSAGLRGFSLSPYFPSLKELDAFCLEHMGRIMEIGERLQNDEGYPDDGWWL